MKPSAMAHRKAFALGFLLTVGLCGGVSAQHVKADSISIFGINDFHGHIQPVAPVPQLIRALQTGQPPRRAGGFAYLDALLTQLRAANPHSITVGAGDMIGATPADSSLLDDQPSIEALNRLGVSLSSLGNHEFDKGPEAFADLVAGKCAPNCALKGYAGAKFDYLAANVSRRDGKPNIAKPYAMRTVGGWKIAFVGAVTSQTPNFVRPAFTQGLVFDDEAAAINRVLPEVRALKPDAIVVVMHEGAIVPAVTPITGPAPTPQAADCPTLTGRATAIAKALPDDVQALFTAHTHQAYACERDGKWLVQGGAHGAHVSEIRFAPNAQGKLVPVAAALHASTHDTLTPSARGQAFVAEVQSYTQSIKGQVVGHISAPLLRLANANSADSPAGRFLADAQLAFARSVTLGTAQPDLAFMNATGIRSNLGEGLAATTSGLAITRADVMAMQPFGNELVLLRMTGADILAALAEQADVSDPTRIRYLQASSNFSYTWRAKAARGEQSLEVRINGQPIELTRAYNVVANSFLAEGGEQFSTFKRITQRSTVGADIDATLFYLSRGLFDIKTIQMGTVKIEQTN